MKAKDAKSARKAAKPQANAKKTPLKKKKSSGGLIRNPNHMDNLNPYPPGVSGNPNGRPKKLLTILKTDFQMSFDDIKGVVKRLMLLHESELLKISKAEDAVIYEKIICKALLKDLKNSTTFNLDNILDRVYGRAVAQLEVRDSSTVTLKTYHIPRPNFKDAEEAVVIDQDQLPEHINFADL